MGKLIVTTSGNFFKERHIKWILDQGITCFRINLARVDSQKAIRSAKLLRLIGHQNGINIILFCDLPGLKARVGKIPQNRIDVRAGEVLHFVRKDVPQNLNGLFILGGWFFHLIQSNDTLQIGDNRLLAQVTHIEEDYFQAKVVQAGLMRSYNGIYLRNRNCIIEGLTEEDKKSALTSLQIEADYVVPSFVHTSTAPKELKRMLMNQDNCPAILSKIESVNGVKNFEEILNFSDGIMIGRDDLSREIPIPCIDAIINRLLPIIKNNKKTMVCASSYFRELAITGKRNYKELVKIDSLAGRGMHFLVSNETAYSPFWKKIVKAAIKCGFS